MLLLGENYCSVMGRKCGKCQDASKRKKGKKEEEEKQWFTSSFSLRKVPENEAWSVGKLFRFKDITHGVVVFFYI